jgi:hypothetical protein
MAATAGARLRVRSIPFAAAAVAANLALTVPLALLLNVWQDEAYTLQTTGAGLRYAFAQAIGFEQNAPLYFVVLTLWRSLNGSIFFLRSFSLLCAALAIWLTPAIVRRYLPQLDGRWITITFAFNAFLIWAALEMRVYAAIVLLSALLLLTFYDAFLTRTPSARAWVLYTLCCIAALYTQYYLAFLIAGEGAYLLLTRRGTAFLRYCAAGIMTLAAFAPMLAILPAQMQNFRGIYSAPETPLHSAATLVSIAARYLLAPGALPHAAAIYAVVAVAIAALIVFFRRRIALPHADAAALPFITVTAYVLLAAAIYFTREHLLNRHAASLLLPTLLSAYAVAALFREPERTRAVIGWSCLSLAFAAVALWTTYSPLAKPGDWIRVNAYIRQNESAGEPIAVFQAENELPFLYYYRGPNRVTAIPRGVNFRRYDVADFVVRDEAQLDRTMPRSAKGIWLITAGECSSANVQFGCGVLESYVGKRYRTVKDSAYYKARIRLLVHR